MSDEKKQGPQRDPLVVTVPNVLAKVAHDQGLIGRNAVRLNQTVTKYQAGGSGEKSRSSR